MAPTRHPLRLRDYLRFDVKHHLWVRYGTFPSSAQLGKLAEQWLREEAKQIFQPGRGARYVLARPAGGGGPIAEASGGDP